MTHHEHVEPEGKIAMTLRLSEDRIALDNVVS
jgi:hypothetical protein